MTAFADASFVVPMYRPTHRTREAVRLLDRHRPCLLLSPVTRLEVVRALAREKDGSLLTRFRADVAAGGHVRVVEPASWDDAMRTAEVWCERAGADLVVGATDMLVVALAILGGAAQLWSFDRGSHQRAVALAAGIAVVPPATRDERGRARRL